VAIAVALVFAAIVANGSIAGSTTDVVHAVVGPANLQLHARDARGFDERLLTQVRRLPGVEQAAPLLEQTATVVGPSGRSTVDLAGADLSLALLDGLAHTLPVAALSPGAIGLSQASAGELGLTASNAAGGKVWLELRGAAYRLRVSAILGREAAGALSQARVAVMPLERLQRLAGLPGRITRVLVKARRGREAAVRAELGRLAGGRLTVAPADQDVTLLRQALRPSDQASAFFAAISAVLGFLLAFTAILLTIPERRRAIADLRLVGTKRSAIVQMVMFQALCLGGVASLVGVIAGYALSLGALHQPTGYLAEAFTLGRSTVVGVRPLVLSLVGGIVAACLASALPLLDLRRGRTLEAVHLEEGVPGNALGRHTQLRLAVAAAGLLVLRIAVVALWPSVALAASALLGIATVLVVPLVFAGVLRAVGAVAQRFQRLTILPVALASLKGATLRSLVLAATGAVAIFGSIALGGARQDLLRGIGGFAHSYAADADLWVANPEDNQATVDFLPDHEATRIAKVAGVASVRAFQGGFLEYGDRRMWIIARPPGASRQVLQSQIVAGDLSSAIARLGGRGWIAVSAQVAAWRHVGLGDQFTLPTPSGDVRFRIAATTTNLAWSPGVVFMSTADYSDYWASSTPSALGVQLTTGASASQVRAAVARALGPASRLEVATAQTRE
ncbi:MAG TPA: ABC transporter permease, partial [Patescibacteria group bacterium]|nr:ABC transporter permease [Patescibacteria group bacterium]